MMTAATPKAFKKSLPMLVENPRKRKTNTWTEHRDINMVMLATSLAPDGYLSA